jgi:hypothetical protein
MEVAWCSDHGLPHSALLDWDPTDRAKLIASLIATGERCTMCGTAGWEWEDDPVAYEPATHLCLGCRRKEEAAEDVGRVMGQRVVLIPRRVAEKRQAQRAKKG